MLLRCFYVMVCKIDLFSDFCLSFGLVVLERGLRDVEVEMISVWGKRKVILFMCL